MSPTTKKGIAFSILTLVLGFVLMACADDGGEEWEWELSEPQVITVDVGGYPVTCVTIIGYSDYGGGVSCDWESWRESQSTEEDF